jgi:phosphopantetheine adenylyltransferase
MNINIRESVNYPGCYDLLVNGHVKIEAESFTICSEVEFAINHSLGGEYGECGELAESIMGTL